MQTSLQASAMPPHAFVEEYHGGGHQVTFKGKGGYSRIKARCELSDLLVVVYDRQTKDARLAYIQAKSERSVPASTSGVHGRRLAANLEQWDLLGRRPKITGVGRFNPPSDLLSGAQLKSVGSFVFFLHGAQGVDIQYAAASDLTLPPRTYSTSSGTLNVPPDRCQCRPNPECLSVYGSAAFGSFLFGLMIGTPILCSGNPATPSNAWLAAQLRGFAAGAKGGGPLATELAGLLDPARTDRARSPSVGAATLLLFSVGPAGPQSRRVSPSRM